MKVIVHETGISTIASGSDTGYPVANIDDNFPKKRWKYTAVTATLTITPGQSSSLSTVALHNIECDSITITENGQSPESLTILTSPHSGQKSIWHEFSHPSDSSFVLTFSRDTTTLKCGCGVLKYGDRLETQNPGYGLSEGYIDYSDIKELSNGARYVKERDIVRTFTGQVFAARTAADYYTWMNDLARTLGQNPASWMLTDLEDKYWHVFARFQTPLMGTSEYLNHNILNFDIIEVL